MKNAGLIVRAASAVVLMLLALACGPAADPSPTASATPSVVVPPPVGGAPIPIPSDLMGGMQGLQVHFVVTNKDLPVVGLEFQITYYATAADGSRVTMTNPGTGEVSDFFFTRKRVTRDDGRFLERIQWPPTLAPCILAFTARASGAKAGTIAQIEVTDGMDRNLLVAGNEWDKAKAGQIYLQFTTTIPYGI